MDRRSFVKQSSMTALSVAVFGTIHWNGKSFEGDNQTTTDILGPFYRPGSPLRSNLIPTGSLGTPMKLKGTVFKTDGKTPMSNVLIEAWQCDENEKYDNTSDDFRFRGAVKTAKDGSYEFTTIVPVPYQISEAGDWRPAHIHLRVSSPDHQDLITQIYFKGDPHLAEDSSSADPKSAHRILEMKNNSKGEPAVTFDIVMSKEYPLDESVYKKITGLYESKTGNIEFVRDGDLLLLKLNGQFMEALTYKGNNTFAGGLEYINAVFALAESGDTKVTVRVNDPNPRIYEATRFLKY